jgi:hypothetical protein
MLRIPHSRRGRVRYVGGAHPGLLVAMGPHGSRWVPMGPRVSSWGGAGRFSSRSFFSSSVGLVSLGLCRWGRALHRVPAERGERKRAPKVGSKAPGHTRACPVIQVSKHADGERAPAGRPFALSRLDAGYAAADTLALPSPMAMVRAFSFSGTLRTRSMCRRPSFSSAPLTST